MTTERPWIKKYIWLLLVVATIFFSIRYYSRLTDGFAISHMTHPMPYRTEWEIEPFTLQEKDQLHAILNQPFYYVGKGAQSYAFLSEDQKYVIKFFKFKHLRLNGLLKMLPDLSYIKEYKEKKARRKNRLIDSVFNGYKLAYDVNREESGLVYIHLNLSDGLQETAILYDKIGREYILDLDKVVFILQKAVKTTRDVMEEALDKGDVELATKRLDQIIDLYLNEYSKGIYDRDHGVMHNTGFVDGQAVHLDVGKLSRDPSIKKSEVFLSDLQIVSHRFESWIKINYPQYHQELVSHFNQRIKEIH